VTLDLSGLYPAGYTAAQTTAPTVTTLVTGPASTATTTSPGTGPLRVGPYTLAAISPDAALNAGPGRIRHSFMKN
jgi:hypothetical protein